MDSHYRPAIVATRGEEFTRGSCRSIGEFHITEALDQCADLLVHHGGHAAAAGFTVQNDNVEALITRLKAIAAQKLSSLDLHPMLMADAEVRLKDMDFRVLEYLDWLQPTGYGNPMPVFVTRNAKVTYAKMVGAENQHLKLNVEGDNVNFGAICFRQGQREVPPYIDIAFMLEKNTYNGHTNLQLNVKDFKASGIPD
jgi:single-stranded-DNA-specific exonuclease